MIRPIALLLAAGVLVGAAASDEPQVGGRRCPAVADDQVWVPGGETQIGSDDAYPEEAPAYRTSVRGFWIDRHEVTNRQFAGFVAATGHVTEAERRGASIVFVALSGAAPTFDPRAWWRWVDGADWRHPEGPGSGLAGRADHPVVHVAYSDALAYARWAGRALPSEEQFERAARADRPDRPAQPEPAAANTWQGEFPSRNSRDDGHAGTAPVGCYRANGFGLHDMIGNVWEWTASRYTASHAVELGAPTNPTPSGEGMRVIKGGSFLCAPNYCARYRPSARHAQEEGSGASHLGFRTVRSG